MEEARRRIRRSLRQQGRDQVYAKTNGHCHICGGRLDKEWTADHVVPHAADGPHALDNYLPACSVCNRLRWHYTPEDIRYILELGIYARREVKKQSQLGRQLERLYERRQAQVLRRRGRKDK
jgi:5-methylcytosine-specific restriction endonuclease McrA